MTTIARSNLPTHNVRAFVTLWANLAHGDDGEMISVAAYTDKSVQVTGTFGAGGTLTVQGSNDGVNWATLTDPQGNDLVFSSAKIELVSEATLYLRPAASGDGTTDLTVHVLLKE